MTQPVDQPATPALIIGKLAEDVARGVYADDAEFFQREFNKILRIAKRNAVTEIEKCIHSYVRRIGEDDDS